MGTIAALVAPLGNRHFPSAAQTETLASFQRYAKYLRSVLAWRFGACTRR